MDAPARLSTISAGFVAQTQGSWDPLLTLAQYGLLGLLLVLTATGYVWWKPAVTDILRRIEKLEEKLDRHQHIYEDVVIPTLKEANDIHTKVLSILWEIGRGKAS